MDAGGTIEVSQLFKERRKYRLIIIVSTGALALMIAGCGQSHGNARRHAADQHTRYTPPRPSATAQLAADRYLYQSEQLRLRNSGIETALKNDIAARRYSAANKIMKNINRESRVDPRYELLYVATLKAVTTCGHTHRAIERALLDYESARPKSPWPHLLLGRYYEAEACHARGEGWAKNVKQSQWKAMINFDRQAVAEYMAALKIDNKLFPAYDGLMRIMMDFGNLNQIKAIYEHSRKYLPKSYILAAIYMNALEPRWGGSYRLMRQFADQMQEHLNENPRFYNLRGAARADKANFAYDNNRYGQSLQGYMTAMHFGDNPDWLYVAGYDAANTGQSRFALTYFRRYLVYKPEDAGVRKTMAKILKDCKSHPVARGCTQKLPAFLQLDPLSKIKSTN